ncbi:MAG TPA: 5-(carboxyamino)imidazole ribonucleotide synthase [Vicinamibacterales bacterium]|nr:5-(carboxyamino)imidazole ribonucleotide synthase [Vicinamibacterales bacterium]
MTRVFSPGSTIGILGGGQLGRMLALVARRMGYRVHTLSPEDDTPTGQIADLAVNARYDDLDAIRAFARRVDVITFEFENVSVEAARAAAEIVPVRPDGSALHVAQQRLREKEFLAARGFPVTAFAAVRSPEDLAAAVARLGCPAVLKTAAFGYDGKGQVRVDRPEDALPAWDTIGRHEAVLEAFVDLECEISVIAVRGLDRAFAHFGAIQNTHRHHILDISVAPAPIGPAVADRAVRIARDILEALDYVGVMGVEYFVSRDGRLLVNELAPRPHNSGHLTIDACRTSQFEQQLRAVCGLPLGSTDYLMPAAMANLLGDLWAQGEPDWAAACAVPEVRLHLYGKTEPRPGRKMGHLTALDRTGPAAVDRVLAARRALT